MSKALQILDMALPLGSLETYLYQINRIPLLSLEEEHELAQRYHQHNDLNAARKMVMAHLRYVAKIARGYLGYGLPLGDLIQEGNVGLMKAVKRFDVTMGVRLVSFAVHWIKAEIHEFILKNWRIVKVATTKAQRKLFFNLRHMKKRLGWFTSEEVATIANDLGVSTKEVLRMEQRLNTMDESFDLPPTLHEDSHHLIPAGYLEDPQSDPAHLLEKSRGEIQESAALMAAFTELDARSQDILKRRWLEEKKVTLQTLASEYKVSAERIRQLEQMAMKKLKDKLM